jgi:hypothetical protein
MTRIGTKRGIDARQGTNVELAPDFGECLDNFKQTGAAGGQDVLHLGEQERIMMKMSRQNRAIASKLSLAAGLAVATSLSAAGGLQRLSAEFQNNTSLGGGGEVATTAAAGAGGAGGLVVYSKTLKVPEGVNVLYVTFSGQADSHEGSALLMTATVNGALVEPLAGQTAGGGGGPHVQTGWYTLLHLPDSGAGTNCNDGGGGTADCHDNGIYFTGCAHIASTGKKDDDDEKTTATVEIKLANLPGGGANTSFYERATIYIDGQRDEHGQFCKGVDTSPH